jgi:hypothetical protein
LIYFDGIFLCLFGDYTAAFWLAARFVNTEEAAP